MSRLEAITARKLILDWRDRWTQTITQRLESESQQLHDQLNREIDTIGFWDALFTNGYVRKKLQPLFTRWCESKTNELRSAAEKDLRSVCERAIPEQYFSHSLGADSSKGTLIDVGTAAISAAMATAAIPAVATFSTTSISVGGLLGFLGVTTSVLITRNLLIGLVILLILFLIAALRFRKIKANARVRLKAKVEKQIREKILYSKKQKSLNLCLTNMIETTAEKLTKELRRA